MACYSLAHLVLQIVFAPVQFINSLLGHLQVSFQLPPHLLKVTPRLLLSLQIVFSLLQLAFHLDLDLVQVVDLVLLRLQVLQSFLKGRTKANRESLPFKKSEFCMHKRKNGSTLPTKRTKT